MKKLETNESGKSENHIGHQNPKICSYFSLPGTENRVLKTANREPQGSPKPKNRNVQKRENSKNWPKKMAKTKTPNTSLSKEKFCNE